MVMDAECREETTADEGPCDDGSEDGIAVVQELIRGSLFSLPHEAREGDEEVAPIEGCCPCLKIVCIPTLDLAGPGEHIPGWLTQDGTQGMSLVEDLRLHCLLPELLPQGERGIELRSEALGLERMSIQREE